MGIRIGLCRPQADYVTTHSPKANEPAAPRAYAGAAERAPRGGGRRPPLRCFYSDQLGHMVRERESCYNNPLEVSTDLFGCPYRPVAVASDAS